MIISGSSVASKHKWYPLKKHAFTLCARTVSLASYSFNIHFGKHRRVEAAYMGSIINFFAFFFFSTKQLLFFYSDISEYKLYSISLFPLHFSLSCYFASWNVLYAAYLTTFAFRETVYTLWSLLKQCNTIVIQSLVSDLGTLGVRNSESSLSMSLDGDSSESFIRIRLFLQTLL